MDEWMGGQTDGWTNRITDVVYVPFMIPRDCIEHTTQFCSVLVSTDPNAVTLLYLALGEVSVLHEIFQKPKLTNVPRLFLPTLCRERDGTAQRLRARACNQTVEFRSWLCFALLLGFTFPICNLPHRMKGVNARKCSWHSVWHCISAQMSALNYYSWRHSMQHCDLKWRVPCSGQSALTQHQCESLCRVPMQPLNAPISSLLLVVSNNTVSTSSPLSDLPLLIYCLLGN